MFASILAFDVISLVQVILHQLELIVECGFHHRYTVSVAIKKGEKYGIDMVIKRQCVLPNDLIGSIEQCHLV